MKFGSPPRQDPLRPLHRSIDGGTLWEACEEQAQIETLIRVHDEPWRVTRFDTATYPNGDQRIFITEANGLAVRAWTLRVVSLVIRIPKALRGSIKASTRVPHAIATLRSQALEPAEAWQRGWPIVT